MSRNFGHARVTRTERPVSVNDPFEEKLTPWQSFVLFVCIALGVFFGAMVGHGYYIWLLK